MMRTSSRVSERWRRRTGRRRRRRAWRMAKGARGTSPSATPDSARTPPNSTPFTATTTTTNPGEARERERERERERIIIIIIRRRGPPPPRCRRLRAPPLDPNPSAATAPAPAPSPRLPWLRFETCAGRLRAWRGRCTRSRQGGGGGGVDRPLSTPLHFTPLHTCVCVRVALDSSSRF